MHKVTCHKTFQTSFRLAYPVTLLEEILEGQANPVNVMYDIACVLKTYMQVSVYT